MYQPTDAPITKLLVHMELYDIHVYASSCSFIHGSVDRLVPYSTWSWL